MMNRIKVSAEGLSRIQSEIRQMHGAVGMHQRHRQKKAFQHQQTSSELSSLATSTTTVKARPRQSPELVPQNTQRKKVKSDMQNLADIILHQAQRIEKQQKELLSLRLHYERQVSTIKSNAEMLEKQLEKLQSNVKKARAEQLCNHSQEIRSAVENLQKCGLDLSQPQTIANHLLTKLLSCNATQKP